MVQPMSSKILIRVEKTEEKTKSGIILAPQAQETSIYAEVLALGPEADEHLHIGDRIILDKFATKFVLNDGTSIIDDSEVLGIDNIE